MLELIAFIISIYLLFKVNKLEKKISPKKGTKQVDSQKPQTTDNTPQSDTEKNDDETDEEDNKEDALTKIFKWYSHEWPLKTGAFLVLLGIVWLLSYAFLNNWIGPIGRITLGMVAGSVTIILAELRIYKERTQGITLSWLGASIILVSIYASQFIYNLLNPYAALTLVLLIMVVTTFMSLRHKSYSLALATLIIAGVTPLVMESGTQPPTIILYSYLTAITLGTVWIVKFTNWRSLLIFPLLIVTFYSLEYLRHSFEYNASVILPIEMLELRIFAVIFVSIFYIASLLPLIKNKNIERLDIVTPFLVGIFSLAWINSIVASYLQSVIALMAAVAYAIGSYLVFIRTNIKSVVYVYTGVATLLLAVATAFEFSGPSLVIALSVQALVLAPIACYILGAENGKWLLLYFILPIVASYPSLFSSEWQTGILHNSFYSIAVLTFSLAASGLYFYYSTTYKDVKDLHNSAVAIIVLASSYCIYIIWQVNQAIFATSDIARMSSLFIYTIIGLSAYIIGEVNSRKVIYWYGLVLLIGVIGQLLLVEIWEMELAGRTITFIAIGVLLIGSVLLRRSRK